MSSSKRAVTRPASINLALARDTKRIRREIKLLGQDLKRVAVRYVRIGGMLARVKDRHPGEWMKWTSKNLPFSHDWAERCIRLHHRFGTDARFRKLAESAPVSVLYILDRHPEMIDEIAQRHESGETITHRTLTLNVVKTIEGPTTVKVPVTVIERGEQGTARVPRGVPAELPAVYTPPSSLLSPSRPSLPPPEPSLPSPEPQSELAEGLAAATALSEKLANVLAKAHSTKPPKLDVDGISEIHDIAFELVRVAAKLKRADATSTETPPEGLLH